MRNRALLVLALILAAVIGGGIARASIPAADGTINGCRKNADGSLKVIDSAATCGNGYTVLNWRQVNPTVVSTSAQIAFDAGGVNGTAVFCPAGRLATGGGAEANTSTPLVLTGTMPQGNNGWGAHWRNTGPDPIEAQVTIHVVCTGA